MEEPSVAKSRPAVKKILPFWRRSSIHSIIRIATGQRFLLIAAAILSSSSLTADRIVLKNGMRLEGTLKSGTKPGTLLLQTEEGNKLDILETDILEGNIQTENPRACLIENSGEEICEQNVEAISLSAVTILELDSAKRRAVSWSKLKEVRFDELAPLTDLTRLVQPEMIVRLKSDGQGEITGIVKGRNETSVLLAISSSETVQIFRIRQLRIMPSVAFNDGKKTLLRLGMLVPGLEQWRWKQKGRGVVLMTGAMFFAGLAAWSSNQAQKARSNARSPLTVGDNLVIVNQSKRRRFNQYKAFNQGALVGLGLFYATNSLDLTTRGFGHASLGASGVELALTIQF